MLRPRLHKLSNIAAIYSKVASGGGGITFTPTDAQTQAPTFGSGSFTVNIGAASSDRIMVFGYVDNNNVNPPSPTYNGFQTPNNATAPTLLADQQVGLFYANVPTGTTATIEFSGGASGVSVVVGVLKGQSGGGSATPVNPTTLATGVNQPLSITGTVPSGGIGIAIAGGGFGTGPGVFTWTGTTAGAGDETTGGPASILGMSHAITSATITASNTSSIGFGGTMAYAAWAP